MHPPGSRHGLSRSGIGRLSCRHLRGCLSLCCVPGDADLLGGSNLRLGVRLRCRHLPRRGIFAVRCVPGGLVFAVWEHPDRKLRLPGASPSPNHPPTEGRLLRGASVRGRRFLRAPGVGSATAVIARPLLRSCAVYRLADLPRPLPSAGRAPRFERDGVRAVPTRVPQGRRRGCGVHPVPGGEHFLGGSNLSLGVQLLCRQLPRRDIFALHPVPGGADLLGGRNLSLGVLLVPCRHLRGILSLRFVPGGADLFSGSK